MIARSASVLPRLSDKELRLFSTPCSWRFLSLVRPPRSEDWWRDAVMDADECGRGLLEWCKASKSWRLSALGVEHLGRQAKKRERERGLRMKFVQAKHCYRGGNEPSLVVIHDMEYPERPTGAEWCADFFAGPSAPKASAHYAVDNDSIVQCVREEDGAWHCPGALPAKGGREINRSSIGIEHAGYARQSADEWLDDYSRAMLELSAGLVADVCHRHGIPAVRLSPDELKVAGARGICGHVDCTKATGVGSHWDPGPNFPWEWYLARVRAHLALLDAPPAQASDDLAGWPVVSVGTSRWRVSPTQLWPIGIGAAEETAERLGCELPSLELVDAIWRAADLRIEPITRSVDNGLLTDWGASMSSLATYNDQAARIEDAIGGRPFTLLAGAAKDVVSNGGRVGLYGWHRRDGSIVQPFYGGHARGWIDYSQGLRLCRRIMP